MAQGSPAVIDMEQGKAPAVDQKIYSPSVKLAAVLLYIFMSGCLTFFNKAVVSVYKFNYSLTILSCQMTVAIIVLKLLASARIISLPAVSAEKARQIAPITALYLLNVMLAFGSLSRVNIPMYNVLKRLNPFVVMLISFAFWRKVPTARFSGAVFLMVFGAIVAGVGDAQFSSDGYLFALGSCFAQASYLLYVQNTSGAKADLDAHGLLFLQALISLPVLVAGAAMFELGSIVVDADVDLSPEFAAVLTLSSVLGSLLNFSLFFCTMTNSALTTTIVGAVKGTVTTVIGFFVMNTAAPTTVNVVGIVINTAGAFAYTLIKAGVIAK